MPCGELATSVNSGPLPTKQRELIACNMLIHHLNRNREIWEPAVKIEKEQRIDCSSRNREGGEPLLMQVTMADRRSAIWRALRIGGSFSEQSSPDEVADRLFKAAEKQRAKADHSVVLVLDAIQTPQQVFGSVVESFRSRQGAVPTSIGFKGIWLVGPTTDFVYRLDLPQI